MRRSNPVLGVLCGAIAAVLMSVVALTQYVLTSGTAFEQLGVNLVSVLALYWVAGLIGGAVFGLLLPLATWRWGAVLVGIVALVPLYIGAAILLGHRDFYSGIIAAILVGGIVGYGLWTPVRQTT